MKKLRKLLAGFMMLAMVISLLPMLAPITAYGDPITTDATIDTSKKGSLTIHKYDKTVTGSTGTGKETDESALGTGNKLAGAGFTIYKVVNLNDMSNYYGNNTTALPNVDIYIDDDGTIKNEYASNIVTLTKNGTTGTQALGGTTTELVTDTNGTVTFSGLDLGFYVVIETTTPPAVTTPMEPFLVSIPMTTVDGADWLYDVHVYPKNETGYGKVILKKVDATNTSTVLKGVTFVLQKLDETDSDSDNNTTEWIGITNEAGPGGDNSGDALTLVTDASGLITVDSLSQGKYRFIETSTYPATGADSADNGMGYIMDGKTAYVFTVNSDKSISYDADGDGNIEEGAGEKSANLTITVENEKPDLTKQVAIGNSWGQENNYSVGDEIDYQITVDVPNNITELTTFKVTDTPTHIKDLIYNENTDGSENTDSLAISLMCQSTAVNSNAYSVARDTTGNGFVITFTTANMEVYEGEKIVISYKAELIDGYLTTTEGNPNTAQLAYSNKILPESNSSNAGYDPDNPNTNGSPETAIIKDNAVVYTFKINIKKVAELSGGTALSGVKFDLYKVDDNGDLTGTAAEALGLNSNKKYTKIATNLTTDINGTVSQSGLANGTYYLVETSTVSEYNLLKAPVEVELKVAATTAMATTWSWKKVDNVKTLVKHEITSDNTTFSNTDDTSSKNGYKTVEIINKKGITLPTTGGVGTYIFIFVGVSMMAAAVILFFATKKKGANKSA